MVNSRRDNVMTTKRNYRWFQKSNSAVEVDVFKIWPRCHSNNGLFACTQNNSRRNGFLLEENIKVLIHINSNTTIVFSTQRNCTIRSEATSKVKTTISENIYDSSRYTQVHINRTWLFKLSRVASRWSCTQRG